MIDKWNGVFSPYNVVKHRDYLHGSWFEHELENGGSYEVAPEFVLVDRNPIDNAVFEPSRHYYMMDFVAHRKNYLYLIPAESDHSEPNFKRIRDTMDEYARNPVPLGRDINDYIDFDEGVSPEVVEWMVVHGYAETVDYRYEPPSGGFDE